MASISESIRKVFSGKISYLLYAILLLGLVYIGYYMYMNYVSKSANQDIPNASLKKNSASGDSATDASQEAEVMLFTVDWCPHCKNAKTPWSSFKGAYDKKVIKDTRINCVEYNLTKKEKSDPKYAEYMKAKAEGDKHKIEGFPTVKLRKGKETIDYDAKITEKGLEEFVKNMV